MKLKYQLVALAVVSVTACTKPPEVSSADQRIDERLQKIEAQLSRIESVMQSLTPVDAAAARSKDHIKIYVSGAVAHPGQYSVDKGISLLAAIAVAGGNTEYADLRKTKISRTGQADRIISDKNAFKDTLLEEGDIVGVPQSSF